MGTFAQNPLLPLGATQNWQNARYSAAATHGAMSSPFEFSKADAAPKETSSAVIPRKRETTTILRVRDQSLRVFINVFTVGSVKPVRQAFDQQFIAPFRRDGFDALVILLIRVRQFRDYPFALAVAHDELHSALLPVLAVENVIRI